MTQDEIIWQNEVLEMAKQAGFPTDYNDKRLLHSVELEAFAKLVEERTAAKEREACAKVCEELPAPDIYNDTDQSMWDVTCMDCSTAIRARAQADGGEA